MLIKMVRGIQLSRQRWGSRQRRWVGVGLATLVSVATLVGCSSEDEPAGKSEPEPTSSASATEDESDLPDGPPPEPPNSTYLPAPKGVTLTAQGEELKYGDEAVLAWKPYRDDKDQPKKKRKQVAVVGVTIDKVDETTIEHSFKDWKITKQLKKHTPYFVELQVKNLGKTGLAKEQIPIYGLDERNTLIEASVFDGKFAPCPGKPTFPKEFGAKAELSRCLVYFVPKNGELVGMSFRPSESFDPIVWSGDIGAIGPVDEDGKKKKGKKNKQDKPA